MVWGLGGGLLQHNEDSDRKKQGERKTYGQREKKLRQSGRMENTQT